MLFIKMIKKTIWGILTFTVFLVTCVSAQIDQNFSSFNQAKLFPITFNGPAPNFFEGALLGNGAMGVVVTTRPDAIVLRFGDNNVWDIRIAENHRKEIGTFNYVFNKIKEIPDTFSSLSEDTWFSNYVKMAGENYNKPYPRPFPCGSVLLGFDRRNVEMVGYKLDISTGVCTIEMLTAHKNKTFLKIFVSLKKDKLWMWLVNPDGSLHTNIFNRIKIIPDPSTPKEFPRYSVNENLERGTLSFRQILPAEEPNEYNIEKGDPKDRAFRLSVTVNRPINDKIQTSKIRMDLYGNKIKMSPLEAALSPVDKFIGTVSLEYGSDSTVPDKATSIITPKMQDLTSKLDSNINIWKDYWNKSGVVLSDSFLEGVWYHNLYFFNCAAKAEATCPGLFANWSYDKIGTAWHGDYHMNYNIEQPFWMTFSSNHLEKDLPYVNLINFLLGSSKQWAREYYSLPGAYFPHSSYPVKMTMNPYPVPTWGWEICETPWAVQGLWLHYLYSGDTSFLKNRAYVPIKEAVTFLVAYMKRSDARGLPRWDDNDFHIFPTIPPELYGLQPGFKYDYDCIIDLALTKFIFKAFQEATRVLGTQEKEKYLLNNIRDILDHYPKYPTAQSEKYGKVLVGAPGANANVIYNVPLPLTPVFPGDEYGMDSDSTTLQMLKNTYKNSQNEGGNDLVFRNLQAARIGMLNLDKFKRQIKYCLLPDGTATDMVMQSGGRYSDLTPFDFMAHMGIWFENFGLPVVINTCLIQSYDGTIRLFPNWPKNKNASFYDLRTVGAFLVSASLKDGNVKEIKIKSEKGNGLRLIMPWGNEGYLITNNEKRKINKKIISIKTYPGEIIYLRP